MRRVSQKKNSASAYGGPPNQSKTSATKVVIKKWCKYVLILAPPCGEHYERMFGQSELGNGGGTAIRIYYLLVGS